MFMEDNFFGKHKHKQAAPTINKRVFSCTLSKTKHCFLARLAPTIQRYGWCFLCKVKQAEIHNQKNIYIREIYNR